MPGVRGRRVRYVRGDVRDKHFHAAAAAAAAEAEYVLKKTENRILLIISGLGPSTDGKDPKKKIWDSSKTQNSDAP